LVPGYIISLGTAVVGAAAYYWLITARRTRALTPPALGAPLAHWTGGCKSRFATSTWGTAELELFDWGVRVSGFWPWKLMLPTWEVRYHELRSAQHVRWPIENQGILFRTDGSAVPLVFSTTRGPQILVHLAMRGVPVEQKVARLNWGTDLRT
jgi:hypothetical protein